MLRRSWLGPRGGWGWRCAFAVAASAFGVAAPDAFAQPLREVWTARVDNAAEEEVDFNIKIDSEGNLVTVGWVHTPAGAYDLLVRKYDRVGRLLWTVTHDGTAHGNEQFGSLMIDSNDHIIVSGTTHEVTTGRDITTIKIDTNGQILWIRRYNGAGNANDSAFGVECVGVDASNNIYVTGYSSALSGYLEMVTVKYGPNGALQWARQYQGANTLDPTAIGWVNAVTPSGDVYAGGNVVSQAGGFDYVVLKYNSAGALVWDRVFDSPYHGADSLYAIAIDAAENVFLTGISESQHRNGDFEYSTVKYNSAGVFQWEGRYGGAYGFHYGWIVAPDNAGGAYVSGASSTVGGEYDIGTVHYDSSGATTWTAIYRDPGYFGDDWAYDLAVDTNGDLIVVGHGWRGFGRGDDAYLLRYSPTGDLLDEVVVDGTGRGDDLWSAVEIGDGGRIVMCGSSLGVGTSADSFVAKYTSDPPALLTASPDPLIARQTATFTLTNVEPGVDCYLAYSVQGPGAIFVPFLNVSISLQSPVQAGPVVTSDATGTAVWNLFIPGNAAGLTVWLQAAHYDEASTVLETQVN